MITKPMLAGTLKDLSDLESLYPVWATPKLDGIRCLVIDGHAVTRNFKPIPNKHIREQVERFCQDGFDGEIMAGENFSNLQSLVMSQEGTPKFEYHVFDYVKRGRDLDTPYQTRIADLIAEVKTIRADFIKPIIPERIQDEIALVKMEKLFLNQGFEGIMLRLEGGPYKCGRSTVREGYLLKLKRILDDTGKEISAFIADSEAEIIGFKPRYHNANKAEKDAFGRTKRSSKKEGKIALDKLGGFLVRDIHTGVEFKVASGLDDAMCVDYWKRKPELLGKILKYQYQKVGTKDKPRFPVFIGFRDKRDMS